MKRRNKRNSKVCGAIGLKTYMFLVLLGGPAAFAAERFQGDLDPVPHDFSNRDNVVGVGTVSANLSGTTLVVTGNFAGLSSPATAAHIKLGTVMAVPGSVIGELQATAAARGEISGSVTLNSAEIAALKKGALYVQLDSVKAADGNSWAWLESTERR
jgi:hypothetical protein